MAQVPRSKLTFDDYAVVSGEWDHELLEGFLVREPAPTWKHQGIAGRIYYWLQTYLETHPLGQAFIPPIDVELSRHTVVQPDVLFISNERLHILGDVRVEGAPDLVVEVLSPDSRKRDIGYKHELYKQYGVNEYWIVDASARCVTIKKGEGRLETAGLPHYDPDKRVPEATSVTTDLLPDFVMPLQSIFKSGTVRYTD